MSVPLNPLPPRVQSLVGQHFGPLTVLSFAEIRRHHVAELLIPAMNCNVFSYSVSVLTRVLQLQNF
jgi:hypothetical protein